MLAEGDGASRIYELVQAMQGRCRQPIRSALPLISHLLKLTEWEPITLLSKPQHFGGVRWHFFCPRWCKRWVRRLYFFPGKWFGCRTCHKLSYRSVQEHDSRLDVFRRNPAVLKAALQAGSLLAT